MMAIMISGDDVDYGGDLLVMMTVVIVMIW